MLTQITPVRFAYIRSVAGELQRRRVLDLGCGGGLLAEPLACAGAEVTGVDVCEAALRIANRHAQENGLCVEYARAAAESLPLAGAAFDVVVAFDVLEHVVDLPTAIQEVARVLKPGGRFIYDTMNRTWLCRVAAVWIGERLWPGGPPRGTHDWHKFIKPDDLLDLFVRNGLTNVETRGLHPVGVDRRGRLRMALGRCQALSYVGYCVRTDASM